ncbi:MAG: flippase [Acidobacteria bacterium]|nr:MAG: flippase [Acidobacteriota bacterium]
MIAGEMMVDPNLQPVLSGVAQLRDMTTVEEKTMSASLEHPARDRSRYVTSGSLLARNTVWNLVGQIAPMVAGLLVIPKLIHGLGTDRFGALSIAWMVVGYFSLFDLGLGRALTSLVAFKLGKEEHDDLPDVVWTANALMLLLGICGLLAFFAAAPALVHRFLKIPVHLQPEILTSFRILSLSIPFVISTAGFRGVLEAKQQFRTINAVRIPLGTLMFLGPLAVLQFSRSLVPSVAVLTIIRALFCGVYLLVIVRFMPELRPRVRFRTGLVGKLLTFGGWMTVTNLIGPVMINMDRFLVGALVSLAAVSYYATPYEIVTKLSIVPFALATVLFPAFSFSSTMDDQGNLAHLFDRSLTHVMLLLFLPSLLMVALANTGMRLWLGEAFASRSSFVLQLLSIGVFANGIAQVPFALVQGMGRPDLTAKLHLAELLLYVPAVWWLSSSYGIRGTALAWVLRAVVDAVLLFAAVVHVLPVSASIVRDACFRITVAIAFLVVGMYTTGPVRAAFALLTFVLFVLTSWFFVLSQNERAFLMRITKFV